MPDLVFDYPLGFDRSIGFDQDGKAPGDSYGLAGAVTGEIPAETTSPDSASLQDAFLEISGSLAVKTPDLPALDLAASDTSPSLNPDQDIHLRVEAKP